MHGIKSHRIAKLLHFARPFQDHPFDAAGHAAVRPPASIGMGTHPDPGAALAEAHRSYGAG
jgi:hypothetical protein